MFLQHQVKFTVLKVKCCNQIGQFGRDKQKVISVNTTKIKLSVFTYFIPVIIVVGYMFISSHFCHFFQLDYTCILYFKTF